MAKRKADVAAGPTPTPSLQILMNAWGVTWDEIVTLWNKLADAHPDIAVTEAELVVKLTEYLGRTHIAEMLAYAAKEIVSAIQTGESETTLDPSALS